MFQQGKDNWKGTDIFLIIKMVSLIWRYNSMDEHMSCKCEEPSLTPGIKCVQKLIFMLQIKLEFLWTSGGRICALCLLSTLCLAFLAQDALCCNHLFPYRDPRDHESLKGKWFPQYNVHIISEWTESIWALYTFFFDHHMENIQWKISKCKRLVQTNTYFQHFGCVSPHNRENISGLLKPFLFAERVDAQGKSGVRVGSLLAWVFGKVMWIF